METIIQTWSSGHWGLVLGVSIWLNITILMVFTYKKIEFLKDRLSDCRCIAEIRAIWQGGIVGRHMRLNMVFMAKCMPGFFVRRGDMTKKCSLQYPVVSEVVDLVPMDGFLLMAPL